MKKLIMIFILVLSFHSSIKADDIKDFEIEGMSIGDSLLDYFTLNEIEAHKMLNYYKHIKKNPGKEATLVASSLGLFVGQADCSALKANTQVYSTELHPSVRFFLCSDHSRPQSPSGFYPF